MIHLFSSAYSSLSGSFRVYLCIYAFSIIIFCIICQKKYMSLQQQN